MSLNTLQIALRNLQRNKVFSVINIVGLAAGIMCTIALFLYVADELSYDRYNGNPVNIYRVFTRLNLKGRESVNAKTASATGKALQRGFPEVTAYARVGYQGEHILKYGDKIFRENNIYLADASYFSLLAVPLLYGDSLTALSQPNSIVLTETSARKYFGRDNPVGKLLQVDNQTTWQVTGVLKDIGEKKQFSCDFLIPMPEELKSDNAGHWFDLSFVTYIKLKDGVDIQNFEKKIQKRISENVAPEAEKMLGVQADKFLAAGNTYKISFQPLSSVYLYSQRKYGIDPNTEWGNARTGDIVYVYIFSAAALFILLIAVMNFVNLSTARSVKRSKEVGIRKTLGSNQQTLITQFMVEAILITFISVILSVVLLQAALPIFNDLSGKDLHLNFASFYTIPLLLAFTFLVGTIAGSYPAFYLSSFKPVTALKEGPPKRKATLRSVLVVTQFAISSILIIGVIAIRKQVNYIQNKDLGFKREFLISIANGSVLAGREKTFKEELLKNPAISSVTNASLMFAPGIPGSGYLIDKTIGADPLLFQFLDVDADFMKTFGLNLREGRFFSDKLSTDSQAVVINEAAARECNLKSPLDHGLTRIG